MAIEMPMPEQKSLKSLIETAFEDRQNLTPATPAPELRAGLRQCLQGLETGALRVAEKISGQWQVHEWLKKAILLHFKLHHSTIMPGVGAPAFDKVALKTSGWDAAQFDKTSFRLVPGAVVREGAHIAPSVVLMPSFVNIGAYVGEGTMVDTWATVGSCAQIGKHVHISGGAGIGGVLEPLQAAPVIIEDNVFIGARSEVAEGVCVGEGAVLAMGVFLGASTKIIDRSTGEIFVGNVPPYAVLVPGSLPGKPLPDGTPGPSLYCAVIVKRVDAQTRAKTAINELLRA